MGVLVLQGLGVRLVLGQAGGHAGNAFVELGDGGELVGKCLLECGMGGALFLQAGFGALQLLA